MNRHAHPITSRHGISNNSIKVFPQLWTAAFTDNSIRGQFLRTDNFAKRGNS